MTNILVRGLSDAAIARIDAEAGALGLSRNEFLRRQLEGSTTPNAEVVPTPDDWDRSAAAFADLANPAVMDSAWR